MGVSTYKKNDISKPVPSLLLESFLYFASPAIEFEFNKKCTPVLGLKNTADINERDPPVSDLNRLTYIIFY